MFQNFADIKYYSIKFNNKYKIRFLVDTFGLHIFFYLKSFQINVALQIRKINYFYLLSTMYIPGPILDTFTRQLLLNLKRNLKI